ncbi:MAG: hypothetical protein QM808_16415 [Steroidobacteraceae bacterium]
MQRAHRARVLDAIDFQERQPKPTLPRRLLTSAMVLVVLLLFIKAVDIGIRVINRFLLASGQGPADVQPQAQPKEPDLTKPYFVTVDPPAGSASSSSASRADMSAK